MADNLKDRRARSQPRQCARGLRSPLLGPEVGRGQGAAGPSVSEGGGTNRICHPELGKLYS